MDSLKYKIIKLLNKIKRILPFLNLKKGKIEAEQEILDKKLVYSFSKSKIPNLRQIKYVRKYLNSREIWLFRVCLAVFAVSVIFLGARFYINHLQEVPVRGGKYTEGLVGAPKYVNPLYANFSDVDSDLSSLIFSSLLKRDKDGQLVNDLAESHEISENNKIYTFKIRSDATWHNNSPLKIDDIIFTFNIIQDGRYKSPLAKSFTGVEIEKIDELTLKFVLAEPYAAFLGLLTFGILPQDLWYQITPGSAGLAELNLKPVGSGPYKFQSLTKDKQGQIKSYNLIINENYYGQKPYIENLNFIFFPNFTEAVQALNSGLVNGISYLPKQLENGIAGLDSLNLHKLNLPQLTAIFFNQKNSGFLSQQEVRQALALAINKKELITDNLGGDARLIDGPILSDSFAYNKENKKYNFNKEEASKLLDDAGWDIVEITEEEAAKAKEITAPPAPAEENPGGPEEENNSPEDLPGAEQGNVEDEKQDEEALKAAEEIVAMDAGKWRRKDDKFLIIKLTAVQSDESAQVLEDIKAYWEDIGVKTAIELIPASQIKIDVIQPRNYEALFYSQILGDDPDLYVLWHSSQTGESGLNLSNYANKDVDQLLEDARVISDTEERKEKYKKFQEIITEDLPAIFLYSPTYTYIQSKKVKGFGAKSILIPRDRFSNITDWHLKTGKKLIWK